jgi:hypothetical protein
VRVTASNADGSTTAASTRPLSSRRRLRFRRGCPTRRSPAPHGSARP